MTRKQKSLWSKFIVYFIAISLVVISFFLPPTGAVDPSALWASALIIAGYEILFGTKIKSLNIDGSGVHLEMQDNTAEK